MLVAVNKIDKEGAQPDRVRTEMTNLGLQPEEWGGETMFVDVSAKTKQNLDDLIESILLVAEVEELKANPDADASGQVIESKLDPGRGAVVTVLVQRGTLKIGDAVVAGAHWGRVRAMHDFHGHPRQGGRPVRAGRGARLRLRPRGGRVRARRRERPQGAPARRRARDAAQARAAGPPRRQEVLAGDDLRPAARRARHRARAGAQGRRLRLAGGLRGRDRQAPAERDHGQRRPHRRRRHHRVRRQPGRRVRRGRARLQRPARRRGRPAGRPRGRRDPRLLGHLPRDRRAARRHAGHARAGGGRGDRRHRRGPRDLPRLEASARSPARWSPTARSPAAPRSAWCATARSSTPARSPRCAASTTTSARSLAGFECGIVLENYADVKEGDIIEAYETRQVERTLS